MVDDAEYAAAGRFADPLDEPVPLSQWVRGRVRLLFRDGAVLERDSTQADAGELSEMASGRREGEIRRWSDLSWVTFAEDRIEAITFDPHPDLGWPVTAETRKRQRDAGHPHGLLRTLHKYWELEEEPSFSLTAMRVLTLLAEDHSPAVIGKFSMKFAGDAGAVRAATFLKEAEERVEEEVRSQIGVGLPCDTAKSPIRDEGRTDHDAAGEPNTVLRGEQAGDIHPESPATSDGDPDPDLDCR